METDDEELLANDVFDSEGHIAGDLNNKAMIMIIIMKFFREIYLMNCFKKLTSMMITLMMMKF